MAINWDALMQFNNTSSPVRKAKEEVKENDLAINSIKLENSNNTTGEQATGNNILTAPAIAMNTETTYNTVQTTMPSGGGISTTAIQASRYRFGLR